MKLISDTMVHYLLAGERNLGVAKAKLVAQRTGTEPMVWIDPARTAERRPAWEKAFGAKK